MIDGRLLRNAMTISCNLSVFPNFPIRKVLKGMTGIVGLSTHLFAGNHVETNMIRETKMKQCLNGNIISEELI